ncbi:hypothetical protein Poly51_59220 [Rubripirellula tenax]|uniref:PEP-CTERM protein-sorting domain-containing protein n=2 Tax=Rubripirellula tenax TaxID=2528015 RepID=A0A5C6E4R4_9BACT|nr:hypothetical protein Poly51_59220 [Rubripirellula tenax]
MNLSASNFCVSAFFCLLSLGVHNVGSAAIVFTMQEFGGGVVLTGTGSVDLNGSGFILSEVANQLASVEPDFGIGVGYDVGTPLDLYFSPTPLGNTNPLTIGPGVAELSATSSSGDGIFIQFNDDPAGFFVFALPAGYISNSPISGTATFTGHSLSSLGVIPGTYRWDWDSDFATLTATSVPEPSGTVFLGSFAILAWIAVTRRNHRIQRRTGGQFSRLLASRSPVPADA